MITMLLAGNLGAGVVATAGCRRTPARRAAGGDPVISPGGQAAVGRPEPADAGGGGGPRTSTTAGAANRRALPPPRAPGRPRPRRPWAPTPSSGLPDPGPPDLRACWAGLVRQAAAPRPARWPGMRDQDADGISAGH